LIVDNDRGQSPVGANDRGWFALVCYLDNSQQAIIDALRGSIPGRHLPPVHITILPPRPLPFEVNEACALVEQNVRGVPAFEAELSEVRCFPETDFLYVDIDVGSARLSELHDRLNVGALSHAETYDYRPHLTLGGPVPHEQLSEVQRNVARAWRESNCPRRVRVHELVCLWLAPAAHVREWTRVHSCHLEQAAVRQTAAGVPSTNQR
jgi:2'-5' RNA ligase